MFGKVNNIIIVSSDRHVARLERDCIICIQGIGGGAGIVKEMIVFHMIWKHIFKVNCIDWMGRKEIWTP